MVTMLAEPGAQTERSEFTEDFREWCEGLYEELLTRYEEQGHYPPAANAAFIARCDEHPESRHKVVFEVMNAVKERWQAERRHLPDCYPIKDLYPPIWEPPVPPAFLPGEHEWSRGPLDDARGQIETLMGLDISNREIIQSISNLCSASRGQSRCAWYVEGDPDGTHPSFAVPPRWHKNVPKIDTIAKRLHMSKEQAQAAVKTGLWFIGDHKVGVYRFREGVDVLVRGHEGAPVIADSPELQGIVELVLALPDSLCKGEPEVYTRMPNPRWFTDEESAEFKEWHARALSLKVEEVRGRRIEQWREDDVRQAESDRLEAQYAATGLLPEAGRYTDWTEAQADGLNWHDYRALGEAFNKWREQKLRSLREEATALLKESLDELGVVPDSIVRGPDCGDLIGELKRVRKEPGLSQLDKWNEIRRLLPMCRLMTTYSVNGAEIEPGEAMEIMRRIDWSAAEVFQEVDWDGNESAARKGDFQPLTGIWQRITLSNGAVLVRNSGHADMVLTWLTRPLGRYKPYEHPEPLPEPKSRKVKPADYEAVSDDNDELWSVRQMAAVNFGAEYADTGTPPPRPLVDAGSTNHEWAAHEGWWDFAHAHPWLIGGLYGGPDQVPPRVYNPLAPAIPRRYKNMGEGALNEPLTQQELDDERKGRVAVMSARQAAVDAYQKVKEAEQAAREARHERRQRERELEEQTRRRMAEAEDRAGRMGLPYESPLSPAWEPAQRERPGVPHHAGMRCLPDCGFPELNVDRRNPASMTEEEVRYRERMHEHSRKRMQESIRTLDKLLMQHRVGGDGRWNVSGQRGHAALGGIIGNLSQMEAVSGFLKYYGMYDTFTIDQVRDAASQCETQYPDAARALREYAAVFD